MISSELSRVLPESLTGVPERQLLTTYRGPLGSVGLRLTQTDGIVPYMYEEGVIYRDVMVGEQKVGDFDLWYDYEKRRVLVDQIYVDDEHKKQGIGTALYLSALKLPLPSGEMPRDYGFYLESRYGSDLAHRRWESLARKGLAHRGHATQRHYIMR